jgi:hypothetical protein
MYSKAIFCFFSVMRQLKIVKPTRQPGKKTQTSIKNKTDSACCMDVKHKKKLIDFIYQQQKY